VLEEGQTRLVSRNDHVYTRFPALCTELRKDLRGDEAVIDGEIVCLDAQGRPHFDQLFDRRGTPSFVAFDLLWMNGRDYRPRPLLERQAELAGVLPAESRCVLRAQHVAEHGVDLFRLACERDLEGIVAKHSAAPYATVSGRSPWVKIVTHMPQPDVSVGPEVRRWLAVQRARSVVDWRSG